MKISHYISYHFVFQEENIECCKSLDAGNGKMGIAGVVLKLLLSLCGIPWMNFTVYGFNVMTHVC